MKWDKLLSAVRDRRKLARITAEAVVRSILLMFFTRLGSLNALGQTGGNRSFWRGWLGGPLPSPDTIGRVACLIDPQGVRDIAHQVYDRLKRGKGLPPPPHGLIAGILDAHESHATYNRHCNGCLERTVHTANGDRTQYYHRVVALSLATRDLYVQLDAEPMLPGEDEVAAALRLLDRVIERYPRAFDLIAADALYADGRFFRWAQQHGKYAMAVLKDDRRDLMQDAQRLFADMPPTTVREGTYSRECWDLEGFTTWPQAGGPVRVVQAREKRLVRRQLDGQVEEKVSNWYWVTTLPQKVASSGVIVRLGHGRWGIENEGFNELANKWCADHVYRHESQAMLVFWLLAQICLNIFAAFFRRNLKPALRAAVTMLHVTRLVQACLYRPPARAPT